MAAVIKIIKLSAISVIRPRVLIGLSNLLHAGIMHLARCSAQYYVGRPAMLFRHGLIANVRHGVLMQPLAGWSKKE